MKCLFLSAKRYSFNDGIINGFVENNIEIKVLDYEDFFNKRVNNFIKKYESLPNKIKGIWKSKYLRKINEGYLLEYHKYKPEIVFIYNNQNIHPETLSIFKKKSKIIFLLGDNPLYTPTNQYNLHLLFNADYIICPDTFWIQQLQTIGIKNLYFDCFGYNSNLFFPINPTLDQIEYYGSEIVYVGSAHKSNWGYKRFLFLNQFKNFDLKVYMNGDGYKNRWGKLFPDLENKIIEHTFFSPEFNNLVYNTSKIAPVELVPSLFNGIHARIFDILGAGIFPLVEYSDDLNIVFGDLDIPFIKNYEEAEDIARNLLNDDAKRLEFVEKMRKRIDSQYKPAQVIKRMLNTINNLN